MTTLTFQIPCLILTWLRRAGQVGGREFMSALHESRTDRVRRKGATISTTSMQQNLNSSLGQATSHTACFRQQAVHSRPTDERLQASRNGLGGALGYAASDRKAARDDGARRYSQR